MAHPAAVRRRRKINYSIITLKLYVFAVFAKTRSIFVEFEMFKILHENFYFSKKYENFHAKFSTLRILFYYWQLQIDPTHKYLQFSLNGKSGRNFSVEIY